MIPVVAESLVVDSVFLSLHPLRIEAGCSGGLFEQRKLTN